MNAADTEDPRDNDGEDGEQQDPAFERFLQEAVDSELERDRGDPRRLRELSHGLGWLKTVIDRELDKRVEAKLLHLKLLYHGFFGSRGRNSKYAHNPCAIREAIRFCRDHDLPPPDWTLSYIHGLMMGMENLPSEQDEKRWKRLMKLLQTADEWDEMRRQGMSVDSIERHFRQRGLNDEALALARSFATEEQHEQVTPLVPAREVPSTGGFR